MLEIDYKIVHEKKDIAGFSSQQTQPKIDQISFNAYHILLFIVYEDDCILEIH